MALLTEEEIASRVAALQQASEDRFIERSEELHDAARRYTFVRPLTDSYANILDAIENVERRFMIGLHELDIRTRGFGPKELVLVTGFSHAGKTQLVNTTILNNRDKRILFFSMDDPSEMILIKLVCMHTGVNAEELERRIKAGDEKSKQALREAATTVFSNLIVVDESLGLAAMDQAIAEATEWWGEDPQLVVIDYLGSMQSDGADDGDGGIKRKAQALKRWVKDKDFPTMVLHQNTRSNGGPGKPVTLTSGGFGGEAEATFVIGVRRKADNIEAEEFVRQRERNTVTLHLVKNKRPPGKKTGPDGIDFFMDPDTGLIRQLRDGDRPVPTTGLTNVKDAMRAREEQLRDAS